MYSLYNYNYKFMTEAKSMMNDVKSIISKVTDVECLCTYEIFGVIRIEAHDDFEMLFPEINEQALFDALMNELAEFKPKMICAGLIEVKMN